jgi:integrase/recombinase XerD
MSTELEERPIISISPLALVDVDSKLVGLWLHGKATTTQRAYRGEIARLRSWLPKAFAQTTLGDLQDYASALDTRGLTPATRARSLAAIKSLFGFGQKIGVLPLDVARPLRLPVGKDRLAERILTEAEVRRLIEATSTPRDRALLSLLYIAGLRISEAVTLRWRDLKPRRDGGQVTVLGKRSKTRTILIPPATYAQLGELKRSDSTPADAVFRSRQGQGGLSAGMAWLIVKAAAKTAGVDSGCSPHWLRHGHASHALDRGAPIHLVKETLGHASLETTSRYVHARPDQSSALFLPPLDQ